MQERRPGWGKHGGVGWQRPWGTSGATARAEGYLERQGLVQQKFTHQLGWAPAGAKDAARHPPWL